MKPGALVTLLTLAFGQAPSADIMPIVDALRLSDRCDLWGDGKIDIVVRSTCHQGDEISVYEYQPPGIRKMLSVGCGL